MTNTDELMMENPIWRIDKSQSDQQQQVQVQQQQQEEEQEDDGERPYEPKDVESGYENDMEVAVTTPKSVMETSSSGIGSIENNIEKATAATTTTTSRSVSTFTEAVPLSISSLIHMSIPLEDGVLDGMRELVQHMQVACVNYARVRHQNPYTLRDLTVLSSFWNKSALPHDVPPVLFKVGNKHQYCQQFRLGLSMPKNSNNKKNTVDPPTPNNNNTSPWSEDKHVLGVISFYYASQELFTDEELDKYFDDDDDDDGTNVDDEYNHKNRIGNKNNHIKIEDAGYNDDDDDDDMPNCILFKFEVQYRSIPPKKENQMALEAEELSMLSFGGSVDDAVKYGALASLYDHNAKYIMELYSVRGKKYKFDCMDSTLSNGRVPRWTSRECAEPPPFAKSLCLTVTDHTYTDSIAKLALLLDGNLRKPKECHPKLHYYTKKLASSFLLFKRPLSVLACPSGQAILMDRALAGQVFVDGRYVTTWGRDSKVGSHVQALFGLDLYGIPVWHGRIVDYERMKHAYALAWQEILVDSRYMTLNLASALLYRTMYGTEEDEAYDDDDDNVQTSEATLESQIMSSSTYDSVGICAKALATRFASDFGKDAIPVESHDVDTVQRRLAHRTPVVVPARLLSILYRGGYTPCQITIRTIWFQNPTCRPVSTMTVESDWNMFQEALTLVNKALASIVIAEETASTSTGAAVGSILAESKKATIQSLEDNHIHVGSNQELLQSITIDQIRLVTIEDDPNPFRHFNICRFDSIQQLFHMNDILLSSNAITIALAIGREHPKGGMVEQKILDQLFLSRNVSS